MAVGLALTAAFLNAAFGFCLGCEMYLIGRRLLASAAVRPPRRSPRRLPHEPRGVLVDTDWVEAHLDDPSVVLAEVDDGS